MAAAYLYLLIWLWLLMLTCRAASKYAEQKQKQAEEEHRRKTTTGGKNDDLVVVVTGASSGIGKSIALEFASHAGHRVWATMRDPQKWQSASINATLAANIVVAPLDVTSEASVSALISRVIQEEGHVDIVVNNAGYGLSGCLEFSTVDQAKALFEVNVWGVVRMLQAVLPRMRSRRKGYIINISSTSGIRGVPAFEYYTSSKFALEGLADSMRYSLAPFNISVTNVNAGPVVTAFTDTFGNADKGGKGARPVLDPSAAYLEGLNELMVATLQRRMLSSEAQSSESVAAIVYHLAVIKFSGQGRATDVPFNIGTSRESQKVLESVRVNPTGWGGVYSQLLSNVPPLVDEEISHEEL